MFEKFPSEYSVDELRDEVRGSPFRFSVRATSLDNLFKLYSGCSFNDGLYRIHKAQDIEKWNRIVGEAFPSFTDRIFCFGYDWLGRQFALDSERVAGKEPLVLMLEPGTGEALEIPVNLLQFHEDELVNYEDEALAKNFFKSWLAAGNLAPGHNQCIGYKKPLFLGGDDSIENLELTDLEVYWSISGQLLNKVRGLPPGTPIGNVTIE